MTPHSLSNNPEVIWKSHWITVPASLPSAWSVRLIPICQPSIQSIVLSYWPDNISDCLWTVRGLFEAKRIDAGHYVTSGIPVEIVEDNPNPDATWVVNKEQKLHSHNDTLMHKNNNYTEHCTTKEYTKLNYCTMMSFPGSPSNHSWSLYDMGGQYNHRNHGPLCVDCHWFLLIQSMYLPSLGAIYSIYPPLGQF